jgi:hypothetical protein
MSITYSTVKRNAPTSGADVRTTDHASSVKVQGYTLLDPEHNRGQRLVRKRNADPGDSTDGNYAANEDSAALTQSCPSRSPSPGIANSITLVNAVAFDSASEAVNSTDAGQRNNSGEDVSNFRFFTLYLKWTKNGSGTTHNVRVIPQFSDDGGTTWYDFVEAPFGAFYQSIDAISGGLNECIGGACRGRLFRLRAVGSAALDGTNNITLTARAEFYN